MSGPQAKRPRPADEGRLAVEDEQHFGAASLLAQVISRALLLAKDEVLADAGLRAGSAEREVRGPRPRRSAGAAAADPRARAWRRGATCAFGFPQ